MNRAIGLSADATRDVAAAIEWLDGESPAATPRFEAELDAVYAHIAEYPLMYEFKARRIRRAPLNAFPYSVYYVVRRRDILIIGVIHQARDEATWKNRRW